MSSIEEKLLALKKAIEQDHVDAGQVVVAVNDILLWLNSNNTDENCRKVDTFVTTQIDANKRQRLPSELADILADMGGALHDTHTAPEVVKNFYSTPKQLLNRLREFQNLQGYTVD